jgi:hypothetical protein
MKTIAIKQPMKNTVKIAPGTSRIIMVLDAG